MTGVPTYFQAISNVLANYNYVDIAAGTGFINFYLGDTVDLKLLSNTTFYSNTILTSINVAHSLTDSLVIDHDFDVMLNRPLDLKGLGIVNIGLSAYDPGATGGVTAYAIVLLRKWDGVTETEIVSNTSSVVSTGGVIVYGMTATDLTIPLTHYKPGETLRLTIRIYATTGAGGGATGYVGYGHDPKSRTTGWDTSAAVSSQLVFQCPVRLNL